MAAVLLLWGQHGTSADQSVVMLGEYRAAFEKWKSLFVAYYEVVIDRECLMCLGNGTYNVHVENSRVIKVTPISDPAGEMTVDDLFHEAERMITSDADCKNEPVPVQWKYKVTFNKAYGYPELIERQYHLHYWSTSDGPEFSSIVTHDDMLIQF